MHTCGWTSILTLLSLLICSCTGDSSTGTFDPQTIRTMQASLDDSVSYIQVPGATIIVVRPDGTRWAGASGFSNIAGNIPMTPELKFRVGSLSKTFTAVVVLQLVQERRLALSDTLESVLPGVVPNSASITIRQLLNHSSGLFDYAQETTPNFLDSLYANPTRSWTLEELIAIANARGPYFAPGNGFHYSNTNYVLLGMIIEKITGQTYASQVMSRIIVPLGLTNTSIPDGSAMPAGSTRGYTWRDGAWIDTTTFDTSWAFGTGSLISNAEDLKIWLDALMNGTLLDQERKAAMFTFIDTTAPGYGYGLGLEKQEQFAVGHTGDFVYGAQAAIYDYKGWRFIVLVNASPARDLSIFGSEFIFYRMMRALGIW